MRKRIALVSEAATAGLDYLERGFEVELVTRDVILPFAAGARQRFALLEALALVEPRPRVPEPLHHEPGGSPQLRLSLDAEGLAG